MKFITVEQLSTVTAMYNYSIMEWCEPCMLCSAKAIIKNLF